MANQWPNLGPIRFGFASSVEVIEVIPNDPYTSACVCRGVFSCEQANLKEVPRDIIRLYGIKMIKLYL